MMSGTFFAEPATLKRATGLFLLAALGALVWAYYPLIILGPGEGHSLFLMEHGATKSLLRFWDLPLAEGPRFVMSYSFVLQHARFGLDGRVLRRRQPGAAVGSRRGRGGSSPIEDHGGSVGGRLVRDPVLDV